MCIFSAMEHVRIKILKLHSKLDILKINERRGGEPQLKFWSLGMAFEIWILQGEVGVMISSTTHPTTKNWQLVLTIQKFQLNTRCRSVNGTDTMKITE